MGERRTSALRAGHGQPSAWPEEAPAVLSADLASAELDGSEICRALARAAASRLGDTAAVRVLQTGERALIPAAVEGGDDSVVASVRRLMATIPVSANSGNPYAETLRTGHARSITGAELAAMQRALPLSMQGDFDELGVTAIFVVPLRALGQTVGTLGCWRHSDRPVHAEAEQALAEELADRAAPAILAAQTLAELARERARRRKTEASLRATSEIVYRLHEGRKAIAGSAIDFALLEAVGLAEATRTFCRQTLQPGGITGMVRSLLSNEPADEARLLLYAIAQEGVRNVRRHSGAEYAMVSFTSDDAGWAVSIRDDGRGFKVADARAPDVAGHAGLRGMQERTSRAGGRLEIVSAPGEGTEVRAWLPTTPAEEQIAERRG